MGNKNANYRKHNDRTHNSSTYHKKDGTPIRAKLKNELFKLNPYHYERYNSFGEVDPVDDFGNFLKDRD